MTVRPMLRALGAIALAMTAVFAVAAPASAAREDLPDVGLTLTFDKASYTGTEAFTLTFTFVNLGSVAAHNVHVTGGDIGGLVVAGPVPNNFDLAPGATHTGTLAGTIDDNGVKIGQAHYGIGYDPDNGDANPDNNIAVAITQVIGAVGSLRGIVFDSAGPRPPGAHIGVPCATIALSSRFAPDAEVARITTDAAGAFALDNLPVGEYLFAFTLPSGYKLTFENSTSGALVGRDDIAQVFIPLDRTDDPIGACPPPAPPAGAAQPALATTGAPALRIGAIGLGALVVGAALVLVVRRRRVAGAPSTMDGSRS